MTDSTLRTGTILLVDDEAYVRDPLAMALGRRGFTMRTAGSAAEALEGLAGLDAVVTDLKMPGRDGHDLVRDLAEREPSLPIVVLTGHGTVASAVDCMKAGAVDYLLKPTDPEELAIVLSRVLAASQRDRELAYLRAERTEARRDGPIGVSEGWKQVVEMVELAAPADTSVLILGESGTGKEEVAKLLHRLSPRSSNAFVRVNCAAIPGELFESELFGHRRGAFTGAIADRDGRFRVAHGGTLLLDEINSLPLVAQAKILRVLQDGAFERVGDSRSTVVDVRLLCASNADLATEVEAGRFRADLYYRINVMTIPVPPLRERRADVEPLATAFLAEMRARLAKAVEGLHPETLAAMEAYPWPGNVRELRNVIERGVLLARGGTLLPEHLPFTREGRLAPTTTVTPDGDLNLRRSVAAAERRILESALGRAKGVKREAARLLGVDERNLAYYLRKHGLMEGEKA